MIRAVAINGSPHKQNGNTGTLLTPLLQGLKNAGCEVDLFYARDLKVRSCNCLDMYCWYNRPGSCCINDDMEELYPKLRSADILVLATPVHVPLPGEMQSVINRLCPLLEPMLETRNGRTRARFRKDVKIKKILPVVTSGWWERENCDTVIRIVKELAADAGAEFAGPVVRPHADVMRRDGKVTDDGRSVLEAARKAGDELIRSGEISLATLDAVSRPLIPEEALRGIFNSLLVQQ